MPVTETCDSSRTPSSSTARGADMAERPDLDASAQHARRPRPARWDECAVTRALRAVMDHGAEFGLGAERVADKGLALEAPHRPALLSALTGMRSMSPGAHRLAEARLFDGHEIDDALVRAAAQRMDHQRARRLRHAPPRSARPASPDNPENGPERAAR